MKTNKSKIRLTISYGYDTHSLELPSDEFDLIKEGKSIVIKGQGFFIEDECTQDYWIFNNKSLNISCENTFQVFEGSINDIIQIENV
jgi:hypothetical protein